MEVLMRRRGILMFSWKNDVTDVTRVDENGLAEQCFQDMYDTFVMGKLVEGPELLDVGVETSVGLSPLLFADENASSADAGIGIGVRIEEIVPIGHAEHLSTQLKHGFCREKPGKKQISVLATVIEESIAVADQVRAVYECRFVEH
jgi:hypothetical protein